MPKMKVDPERYIVQADGKELRAMPVGKEGVGIAQGSFVY